MASSKHEALVLELHAKEAVKFGSFKLKSGLTSPIYLDLRVIVSYPSLLEAVAEAMWDTLQQGGANFDNICGVPYTAMPIATCMSLKHAVPMLMRRKEVKDYGTKKAIEGAFTAGQKCLVVEDLVTSGASVLETVAPLQAEKLAVSDVVVLIDRQQGGQAHLASQGLKLHAALTITFILDTLVRHGKVTEEVAVATRAFIAANQTNNPAAAAPPPPKKRATYASRAVAAKNPAGKRLFEIMEAKKTNLCVAADVPTAAGVIALADATGPHICCLKTHCDAVDDWTPETAKQLAALAEKHNFLIFEDRKFADIGNTVVAQFSGGVYHIADWSHITNAHIVPGPGIIDGLKQVGLPKGRGLLLLAEMSSKGTMANGAYTLAAAAMARAPAKEHPEFVMGFISVNPAKWGADLPQGLVHMTPGVQLQQGGDALGQQYLTPQMVIGDRESDVIIVGRGVCAAKDPAAAAVQYKEAGWAAHTAKL